MHDLVIWYLAVEMLGIAALPVTALAFAHLPDRGWALAKPLAILLIGVACWLPLVLIPALPFSRGWIVLTMLLFVAANAMLVVLRPRLGRQILDFVRRQWLHVLFSEGIFAAALWLMGSLRALNPQAEGTEKFMDQAFLSAIIRTPHLPPPDPWLSGYSINYYYFGHYLLGMLAKALDTPAPVAFNIGIALTCALAAAGIYSMAANLTAMVLGTRSSLVRRGDGMPRPSSIDEKQLPLAERARTRLGHAAPFALFGVLAALVLGNLRSFWIWWDGITATAQQTHQSALGTAWGWLTHPALWANYDYWHPSRAIPLTITEFPSFSFLLADLHAHLLALPYAVLAVGVALHLWLAPADRCGLDIFGSGRSAYVALIAGALSLGALYLINGWDLPTYLLLALAALALHQWNAHGRTFNANLARSLAQAALPLIALCFIPYLPFYLTYIAPSQGIGIVPGTATHVARTFADAAYVDTHPGTNLFQDMVYTRTAIGDEIGASGIMLFILASWLLVLLAQRLAPVFRGMAPTGDGNHDPAEGQGNDVAWDEGNHKGLPLHTVHDESGDPFIHAHMVRENDPQSAKADFAAARPPGAVSTARIPSAARSPAAPWRRSWLTVALGTAALVGLTALTPHWDGWTFLWAMLLAAVALWLALAPFIERDAPAPEARAVAFPLLLVALGAGLIALCEIVYLRDVFAGGLPRMNTVFKFYFQVWLLFALAGAPALAWLAMRLPQRLPQGSASFWQPIAYVGRGVWGLAVVALLAAALIFPLGASHALYPIGQQVTPSLNGLTDNSQLDPGDIAAIQWLNAHVTGSPVIVEAIDPSNSDYSFTYGRVSVFTGLPTLMGWPGHEEQWRVKWLLDPANAADYNARLGDLHTIYTSADQRTVLELLHHYNVRYVYAGPVEMQLYGATSDFSRFARYLRVVYDTGGVAIYQVPNS